MEDIRYLADLFGDPNRNVISFWCMGFNQHTRGTWINNLVYNIHLLTGKISKPGNSPFSLTGQPSACGTTREVGTFSNRLPHGFVTNEGDRALATKIWNVPVEKIPATPVFHTVEMFRALDRAEIKFIWIQTTNPMLTMPNLKRYRDGANKEGRFVVVSDNAYAPVTPHPQFTNCVQCHVPQRSDTLFRETDWASVKQPTPLPAAMKGGPPPIPHSLQTRENCLACHSGPSSRADIRSPHPARAIAVSVMSPGVPGKSGSGQSSKQAVSTCTETDQLSFTAANGVSKPFFTTLFISIK